MLLNDIGKSPDTTFKKINQHLETNYGFKISEDVTDKDIVSIMETIENEIVDLKIKGEDAKASSEISKRLLILEGLKSLREYTIVQFQSPKLDYVVDILSDFVCDSFCISGTAHEDFEECMKDAMKQYRSSKYRFPDELIDARVREEAMSKINSSSENKNLTNEEPILGEAELEDVTEVEDPWASVGKRSSGLGGHIPSGTPTPRGAHNPLQSKTSQQDDIPVVRPREVLRIVDNPDLELGDDLVYDPKTGRTMPDPFKQRQKDMKKGIYMKENLVKNLRRLLETEVSQAEVMMAAKGFAQELQEMIEKIGRLQNEDLPPVTDQMRETYGTDSSSAFQTQIYGALQGVMDSLYTAKGQVDDAVTNMAATGRVDAQVDMDKNIGMDADLDMGSGEETADLDLDNIEDQVAGDEFGGAETEEPLGRAKKMESLENKVMQMRKLVEKARKLKESR